MNKEFEGNKYTQTENDHAGAENTGAGNIPDQGKKKSAGTGKKVVAVALGCSLLGGAMGFGGGILGAPGSKGSGGNDDHFAGPAGHLADTACRH